MGDVGVLPNAAVLEAGVVVVTSNESVVIGLLLTPVKLGAGKLVGASLKVGLGREL